MNSQGKVVLLFLSALLFGCGESVMESHFSPPEGTQRTMTSSTLLSAGISGPTKTEYEDSLTFTASVDGGSAPYYYQWIAQPCYEDGTCRSEWIFAEGQDLSSATLLVRADEAEVKIGLQVREATEIHYSGVAEHSVIGPAGFSTITSSSWSCREPTSFPHRDYEYKNGEWVLVDEYARKCDGTKVSKPK